MYVLHQAHISPFLRSIDAEQLGLELGRQSRRVRRRSRTDHQEHVVFDDLRIRPVECDGRLFVEARLANISGHADDFAPDVVDRCRRRAAQHGRMLRHAHALSERILGWGNTSARGSG